MDDNVDLPIQMLTQLAEGTTPNFVIVAKWKKEIYANAIATYSERGGGEIR